MGLYRRSLMVLIFAIIFSISSVSTKTLNKARRRTRVLKVFPDSECLYTYTAVQPNLDVIKEKVAEFTVDRCAREKRKQEEWVEKQKQRRKMIRRKKISMRRKRLRTGKRGQSKHKKDRTSAGQKPNNKQMKLLKTKSGRGRKVKSTKRSKIQKKKIRKFFVLHKQFKRWKTARPEKGERDSTRTNGKMQMHHQHFHMHLRH